MDRERAKELLPIITAFAEGKAIQARNTKSITGDRWSDFSDGDISFEIEYYEYRIKPSPRTWYVRDSEGPNYLTKFKGEGGDWIKVMEVLDD